MTGPIRDKGPFYDQPHQLDSIQIPGAIESNAVNCHFDGIPPAGHIKRENNKPSEPGQSGPNMGRSLSQILIILVVILVLVNIPFNSYRAGLAQLMPSSNSIVIRDGTLLKGSGSTVYVVDNYKLRPISSEAQRVFFGRSRRINTVDANLLGQFAQGPPVYRLLQCRTEADVFAVENGYKRLVTKLPTNAVQAWDKVHFASCNYLEQLPDGPPIP